MHIALGFAPAEISVQLILIAFVKGVAELRSRHLNVVLIEWFNELKRKSLKDSFNHKSVYVKISMFESFKPKEFLFKSLCQGHILHEAIFHVWSDEMVLWKAMERPNMKQQHTNFGRWWFPCSFLVVGW